ncbi:MAG: divergent polysaccharide deacetylase family protein [Candidatus Omnitrophota bacterium]|jgi:hypothetical protein
MPKPGKTLFFISLAVVLFVVILAIVLPRPKPKKAAIPFKGKIAIVIDDWGYNPNNLSLASQIRYPLTCAVLPSLKNSKPVAMRLHELGFEIILHLPMEPKEKYKLERDTITISLNAQDIRRIIADDLKSLVFVKGVSNHMGSRVTESRATCEIVLKELSKRNLYFLDSFVTSSSVAFTLARKMGLKCAKRDVFLDNRNEPEYIRQQLRQLKKIALNRGVAIGIGHDRKVTLKVLSQMMPQLAKEGYEFVFVSEVVK